MEFVPVSGRGRLYSFTLTNRDFGLGFPIPYVTAYVELDDTPGVRLATNVVGCPASVLAIDLPMEVVYHDYPDKELTLAYFTPVSDDSIRGRGRKEGIV